jgi:2,3-dihydro-2,3-dihydroxybenzoate dehydrogenase
MMRRMGRDHPNVDDLALGSPEAFPRIPAGRVGRTADVASAVAFLLHPDNRHIAMQDLVVDGGELLGM